MDMENDDAPVNKNPANKIPANKNPVNKTPVNKTPATKTPVSTPPVIAVQWDSGADQALGLPCYETAGAAGADLRANLADRGAVVLAAGARALIPTGLRMAIPVGFEVQIRARSGLALRHGIGLVNAPGTIDSDYRGPVGVIVINFGADPFHVTHGMRIAQMVVAPVVQGRIALVTALDETPRGAGGFGSTGL